MIVLLKFDEIRFVIATWPTRHPTALTAYHTPSMVYHMKTTFNIDDTVMQRLKEVAAQRRTTMSALMEAGIRHILAEPDSVDATEALRPLPKWRSGGFRVDIANREALYRVLEDE